MVNKYGDSELVGKKGDSEQLLVKGSFRTYQNFQNLENGDSELPYKQGDSELTVRERDIKLLKGIFRYNKGDIINLLVNREI